MHPELRAMRELWCAVIWHALTHDRAGADAWMRSKDFIWVCDMAGVAPDVVRRSQAKQDKRGRWERAMRAVKGKK